MSCGSCGTYLSIAWSYEIGRGWPLQHVNAPITISLLTSTQWYAWQSRISELDKSNCCNQMENESFIV